MNMLYDSDTFVVVYLDANAVPEGEPAKPVRDGYEIVDKRTNTEVYLDGAWADAFSAQIECWKAQVPEQDEVEAVLESYSQLAHYPLVMH